MRALAIAALLVAGPAWAAPAPGPSKDASLAPLRHELARLERERELSAGKGFYLRLDAGRGRLALMLQGVTLDEYAAHALELGTPEVLFVNRRARPGWDVEPISKGRLEPERQLDRVELIAPAPVAPEQRGSQATPSPPPLPKSAEESVSVPSPYRIVFAEGVSLELRAAGDGRRNRSPARRLSDAASLRLSDLASALGLGSRERVRLRLTLEAEDAAALYRSLPPDVGLIVVGLGPR